MSVPLLWLLPAAAGGFLLGRQSAPEPPAPRPLAHAARQGAALLQRHAQALAPPGIPRGPGARARRRERHQRGRAADFRARAQQIRDQAAAKASGVYVGGPWVVGNVGAMDRWRIDEARSAGALLLQAARCSPRRSSRFKAHGWIVTLSIPLAGTRSLVGAWRGQGRPTGDDRQFLQLIAANAGTMGGPQERDQGSTVIWQWRGRGGR